MGIKIKTINAGSELFFKINKHASILFYVSIIYQIVILTISLFLIHNTYYLIIGISYLVWIILSLLFTVKITSNLSLKNLKFFPIFITVLPIIYFCYFLFRNKYPAQTDDEYLKKFYRKQKIKSIL
jgi:magnesium-transporting ATPase (P-type)